MPTSRAELESTLAVAEGLLMGLSRKHVTRSAVENATALLEGRNLSLGGGNARAGRKEIAEVRRPLARLVDQTRSRLREAAPKADRPVDGHAGAPEAKAAVEKARKKAKGRGGKPVADKNFEKEHPRAPKNRTGGGQFILKKGDGYGDEGPNPRVQQLQDRLGELGYNTDKDGQFGPYTEAAVTALQDKYGLKATGKVDAATLTVLRNPPDETLDQAQDRNERDEALSDEGGGSGGSEGEAEAGDKADKPDATQSLGADSLQKGVGMGEAADSDVKSLQQQLTELGHDVETDGRFGPDTEKALKKLQRKYGLKADGIVSRQTKALLKRLIAKQNGKDENKDPVATEVPTEAQVQEALEAEFDAFLAESRKRLEAAAAERSAATGTAMLLARAREGALRERVEDLEEAGLRSVLTRPAAAVRAGRDAFDELLHPRDRYGRFREVLGKVADLDVGQSTRIGKTRVTRSPHDFVIENPEAPLEREQGVRQAALTAVAVDDQTRDAVKERESAIADSMLGVANPGFTGLSARPDLSHMRAGSDGVVDAERAARDKQRVLSTPPIARMSPAARRNAKGEADFEVLQRKRGSAPPPNIPMEGDRHPGHGTPPPAGSQSWAPEVIADSSGKWAGNSLRFATKEEAEANVRDLQRRWLLVRDIRVVPADEEPNYRQPLEGGRPERIDGGPLDQMGDAHPGFGTVAEKPVITGPYEAKDAGWKVGFKQGDHIRHWKFRKNEKDKADALVAKLNNDTGADIPNAVASVDVDPVHGIPEDFEAHPGFTAEKPGAPVGAYDQDLGDATVADLASMIRADWKNVNFGAVPYLDAMDSLGSIDDSYGMDSGRMVVSYFLSNATGWRGETAKKVKAELRKRLK